MDVDNVNTNLDVNQLERSLKKKNWNAIFPSQRFLLRYICFKDPNFKF